MSNDSLGKLQQSENTYPEKLPFLIISQTLKPPTWLRILPAQAWGKEKVA